MPTNIIAAATMRPGGIACRVIERQRVGDLEIPAAQGQLIEVRRHASAPTDLDAVHHGRPMKEEGEEAGADPAEGDAALYGYVRFKDTNNRRSAWIPLEHILVTPSSLNNLSPKEVLSMCSTPTTSTPAANQGFSARPRVTLKSSLYNTATDDMRRARDLMGSSGSLLEFFDARLRRDVQCPSPIRYIHYLHRLSFAPWYFSPVDVLYPSFDWRHDDILYDAYLCPFTLQFFTSASALERYHRILCLRKDPPPPTAYGQRRPRPRLPATAAMRVGCDVVGEGDATVRPTMPMQQDGGAGMPPASSAADLAYRGSQHYMANRLHPPGGEEIYRDDDAGVSLFEISGKRSPCYARNLFLIGKGFLENKLAGHDVDVYMFYSVCLHAKKHTPWVLENLLQADEDASRQQSLDAMVFAGYFSWEDGVHHDNLACIAVLPCFSGIGLGHFLIAASYELAYRRGDVGSPERPLSDLGELAYRVFWRDVIFQWLALRMADELEASFDIHPPTAGGGDESSTFKEETTISSAQHSSTPSLYTSTRLQLKRSTAASSLLQEERQQHRASSSKWQFSRRVQQTDLLRRCVAFLRVACDTIHGCCTGPQPLSSFEGPSEGAAGGRHATAVDVDDESGASSDLPTAGDDDGLAIAPADGNHGCNSAVPSQKLMSQIRSSGGGGELRLDIRLRVSQVAQEVALEEPDVLDCLLWCGLMHRGSQEGTTCVKVPILYVASMVERRLGRDDDTSDPAARDGGGGGEVQQRFARFDPAKLAVPDRSTGRKRR